MTHTRTVVEIDGGPDRLMYEVYTDGTQQHTLGFAYTEEDANLIAAAPDLLGALREIAKGEGAYSRDQLTHAKNTIDSMLSLASHAIARAEGKEDTTYMPLDHERI